MSTEPSSKQRKLNDNTTQSMNKINAQIEYNICNEVRETCKMVLLHQTEKDSDHKEDEVMIDEQAIEIEVEKNADQYLKQSIDQLEWKNDAYHYFNEDSVELTLRFILVLDSLNFCFWPLENYEYDHLGSSLKYILENDPSAFDPVNLMKLSSTTLNEWLLSEFEYDKDKNIEIPLLLERTRFLNEVGRIIHCEYDDKVGKFVQSANHSAPKLVELVTKKFRCFADHCIWPITGHQTFLYKRAQIFVAEIYAAFKGKGVGYFEDIGALTSFADYRVPQLLRSLNILKYSKRLGNIVDAKKMIHAGSRDEILIRAAMICAVEKLKDRLNERRRKRNEKELTSIEIDWCLWNRGEQLNLEKKLKPHHRTLTTYY